MGRSSAGAAVGVEEAGQVSGAWRSALRKVLKGMRTSQIGRVRPFASSWVWCSSNLIQDYGRLHMPTRAISCSFQ